MPLFRFTVFVQIFNLSNIVYRSGRGRPILFLGRGKGCKRRVLHTGTRLRRVSELPFCKLVKPVSGALAHETGFTNKSKLALCFYLGNCLFPVYDYCSNLSLVLYCIAYAAGGPFSVAQKRGEKTLWPGLTRHACGRALKRRTVFRAG